MAVGTLWVTSCSEDNELFTQIGSSRIFFVDPDLRAQSIKDAERPIQVAEWRISEAVIRYDDTSADLLAKRDEPQRRVPCQSVDTAASNPLTGGRCGPGLLLEATTEPLMVTLDVRFTMRVRRAQPLVLAPDGDYDHDGIDNRDDVCPLLPSARARTAPGTPRERDAAARQAIDPCSFRSLFTGSLVTDSDGDGVTDGVDNCIYRQNPAQRNTSFPTVGSTPVEDLIGDACVEERADVMAGGSRQISLTLGPFEFLQPLAAGGFFVVDFSSDETLSCNWSAGVCELDTTRVRGCYQSSSDAALRGCS